MIQRVRPDHLPAEIRRGGRVSIERSVEQPAVGAPERRELPLIRVPASPKESLQLTIDLGYGRGRTLTESDGQRG